MTSINSAPLEYDRISIDPHVMMGKPVIKGTRLPVEQILRELAGGMAMDDVIDAHPRLTVDDIYAAFWFAADVIHKHG